MIERELIDEKSKQAKLLEASEGHFYNERTKLVSILEEQRQEHTSEKDHIIANKEGNLNFVSNENDELETRILRLKETIVDELEKIEEEHTTAVNELVNTYEQSVKLA